MTTAGWRDTHLIRYKRTMKNFNDDDEEEDKDDDDDDEKIN